MNTEIFSNRLLKWPVTWGLIALMAVAIVGFLAIFQTRGVAESTPTIVVSNDHSSAATSAVNRITANITSETFETADHPFTPLIAIADQALAEIDRSVVDYTSTLNSQVFVNNQLRDEKCMFCKIRHAVEQPDGTKVPFSIYTKFLQPQSSAGQEVIWVDSWHEGNLIVHLSGWGNLMKFYLDPTGATAMDGNRHPVFEIGIRNLIVKMRDVAQRDRAYDEGRVRIKRGVKINDRTCTLIEASHPHPRDHFEFHIARIYIDDQISLPIAYEGYSWPKETGDAPQLIEKYYYTDIQLNVGMTDRDFDPDNQAYNFPTR